MQIVHKQPAEFTPIFLEVKLEENAELRALEFAYECLTVERLFAALGGDNGLISSAGINVRAREAAQILTVMLEGMYISIPKKIRDTIPEHDNGA